MDKIIGDYVGTHPGPLCIAFGGTHGNEKAGVQALQVLFKMLETEPLTNPGFVFHGRLVGLLGNRKAYEAGRRFIKKDLNRSWTLERTFSLLTLPLEELDPEDLELRANLEIILALRQSADYERMVVIDLHTTSAQGGIFSIPTEEDASLQIAKGLHAPVIKGLLSGLKNTTLHFFNRQHFPPDTTAVSFEGGHHDDPKSVQRTIAALVNCLRTIGCVRPEDVENRHDLLLQEYAQGLPEVCELIYRHHIEPEDRFVMRPGFHNFQEVHAGQVLADDEKGPVPAPLDGLILMPLYQKEGEDGFFLVQPVE